MNDAKKKKKYGAKKMKNTKWDGEWVRESSENQSITITEIRK